MVPSFMSQGCLNWKNIGIGLKPPSPFPNAAKFGLEFCQNQMGEERFNATDNRGLDATVKKLEKLYTTADWPNTNANSPHHYTPLPASLKATGKSRADLWQFAGLVTNSNN